MSGSRWKIRGSYGRTLHKTIRRLQHKFDNEPDHDRGIALARTIGYLVSVQASLIKDDENSLLEKRVAELERRAGVQ
jgi:hypothetical protein